MDAEPKAGIARRYTAFGGTRPSSSTAAKRRDAEHPHRVSRLAGRARDVRREDDVLEREQLVADRGLVLEDVECRTRDRAGLEGGHERGLVDDRPARGVHEDGRGLHRSERGGVDEVSGLVRERAVQADDVGRGERRVQVVFPSREDDAGAVRGRELGDAAADPPRADDEELLALEALPHHEVRPPLPLDRAVGASGRPRTPGAGARGRARSHARRWRW